MTRLIDADALNAEMYHKSFEVDDGRNIWNSGLWIRYKIFEEAIRDAPTIDAVPVVHGRWIDEGQYADYHPHHAWRCSECGEHVIEIDTPWYKYCPNCGADMRGEKDV